MQELLRLQRDVCGMADLRSDSRNQKSFRLLVSFLKPSRFIACFTCFRIGPCSSRPKGENRVVCLQSESLLRPPDLLDHVDKDVDTPFIQLMAFGTHFRWKCSAYVWIKTAL